MFLCCSSGRGTSCWHCLRPQLLQQQASLRCLAAVASWLGRLHRTLVCLQQLLLVQRQVHWGEQLLQQQQQ
jgi:hypothetical protein